MKAKLSPRMLQVLKAIDAGEPRPKGRTGTLSALWSRGLIEDVTVQEEVRRVGAHGLVVCTPSTVFGWRLTKEGKLAVKHGRQMLSRRRP